MVNYKKIVLLLILGFLFISCFNKWSKNENPNAKAVFKDSSELVLKKLTKLKVVGDFKGNGTKDTLFQSNFSEKFKKELVNAPDPFQNDWDKVQEWFYDQDADVLLKFKYADSAILHLGIAQGLYCLINVGDTNSDGKDEIALVIDNLDDSRINTCKIYSFCNNQWVVLKAFDIFEEAFDFENTNNQMPNFTFIKDFLEQKNGKWYYKDYSQNEFDNPEDVGKLLPLTISMCDIKTK